MNLEKSQALRFDGSALLLVGRLQKFGRACFHFSTSTEGAPTRDAECADYRGAEPADLDGGSPAGTRCAHGEWEVRGDAPADTRFHFRAGIPSVVHPGQAGSWLSLRICLSKTVAGA